ncbi:putative helicase [Curtobacterium sp. PvP017]
MDTYSPAQGRVSERPANEATHFDRLLDELRRLADSERMKGNYLEQLAKHFLTIEPLWADQLGSVWLWKDWPARAGRPDTGIDLVAEIQGGGLLAVQVKFFKENHRIDKKDLDSFFEAMGKEPFTEGLVIDTTAGPWSAHAEEALRNRTKPVRRASLDELRHCAIDWSSYELKYPAKAPTRHTRKTERAHQRAAISAVINGFSGTGEGAGVDRGKMIMACGTGKTFTSLKLAERWTREYSAGTSSILFMVPSLALLQQSLTEWSAERDPELGFQAFAVGSDLNIGRTKNDDLTSVRLEDLGAPATTDGRRLAELLDEHDGMDGMTVVFSTYQSVDAIASAQQLGAPVFDLIICDEAHRTTGATLPGEDESHFVRIHDDTYVAGIKRIYMTATPRIFAPEVKNLARQKDAELISMDDESLFGPELYRIGFDEAVRAQLLTDYKVIVLGVSEDQIVEGFQRELADDGHELQIGDVAKLIGCYNALAKRNAGQLADGFGTDLEPMRRAVAFAKDIKTSKGIANDFETLVDGHLSNILNDDPTDDLTVQARHIDGTMNATERGVLLDWLKSENVTDRFDRSVARVLTNARCLSEGVDVPSLDAVLFLHPRKSQVDVVQAVGRVMRRAEGKRFGYIVLPIAIPAGLEPEEALNDNDRYRVVWQVLQALRAHDERLDTAINQAALTGVPPEQITVLRLDLTTKKVSDSHGIGDGGGHDDTLEGGSGTQSAALTAQTPLFALADAGKWKDAVFAKLVAKVGDRMYWDDWAGGIADIAQRFIALIRAHLDAPGTDKDPFDTFLAALLATVNPDVGEEEAIEMLAQHLITKPVFEAMFPDSSFSQDNPVSLALEAVLDTFQDNSAFEREREPLDLFYARVTDRIRRLPTVRAKQELLRTLYDKFFTKAFPLLAEKMGIVFTPVELVDYILRSADELSRTHFGKGVGAPGVNIIDPFVGTGTFMTRLLQIGLVQPADLSRKYSREMFANEIVLLSYYIAAVNIESVYREICADHGIEPEASGFQGISLTDTFAMDERDNELAGGVFPENAARLEKQRSMPINVVVMNPPYRAGQSSANDDSKNAKYPTIDEQIKRSYVALSSGTRKADLYDSYYRAIRWATDRIGGAGIIAFVSNSGFLEGATAQGVRLSWVTEFSQVIVYNLRGNQRKKEWRAEGGKVFGEGSQTGVAITFLIKEPDHQGPAHVHYRDIGDSLSREEKLERLVMEVSVEGTEFTTVTPNESGDWINHRDERFGTFQPIGDKATKGKVGTPGVFATFALGTSTNRDAWVYNFSRASLRNHIGRLIDEFAEHVDDPQRKIDGARIGWSSKFDTLRRRGKKLNLEDGSVRRVNYRPFLPINLWYDTAMIDRPGISEKLSPTEGHHNLSIAVTTDSRKPSPPLIVRGLVDLNLNWSTQVFPRYIWEPTALPDGGINLDALEGKNETNAGYRRIDNITDATLVRYRESFGASVSKDDIFYGVYALLHHPSYREQYAADLTKMLPRIPLVKNFPRYSEIGRELAELHLNYEDAPPHPDVREEWKPTAPDEATARLSITKPAWASRKDHTMLRYNEHLTLTGIPEAEAFYKVGGRSPLEWVIDRYYIKADAASGIVNDPNDWLREQGNPRYLVDLMRSLVTVSLETQRLLTQLPDFVVTES